MEMEKVPSAASGHCFRGFHGEADGVQPVETKFQYQLSNGIAGGCIESSVLQAPEKLTSFHKYLPVSCLLLLLWGLAPTTGLYYR